MPNRKLRDFGSPVGYQAPGHTTAERPQVGPAAPDVRSQKLREALSKTEAPPPKPKATPSQNSEKNSLALDQAARNLRKHKARMQQLDEDMSK
jgi:hypothetical protein